MYKTRIFGQVSKLVLWDIITEKIIAIFLKTETDTDVGIDQLK